MKHLHLKYFTLLALFFALGIKAQAYDCCVDGIYYNLKDDEAEVTCEIIDHADCYSGSITIPSTITYKGKNYKVTKIGNKAFLYCHSLTSVSIPNSVTIIGDYAFQQCDELTKIEIPNGVTTLGNGVFRYCIKLQSINFPNSVTSIGIHTFTECHALTSVTLPENITTIGDYFFSLCYSLSSFEIPQSVTSIGNFAFKGCAELSSIAIPNSVTSIGKCAFQLCQGLTSVEIGSGVTSIGNNTFKDCDNLTSVTFHCVNIGDWFAGIESIKEIVIGDEVKNIGYSAFRGCSSVESVILGDNVTKIEYDAFGSINTDAKFYVNRGTPSLLALWTAGLKPYEIGTRKKLMPPYLELVKVTQSTATLKINYMYKDYVYSFNGQIMTDSLAVVNGLLPEHQYSTSLSVSLGDVTYHSYDTNNFWTDKISPSVYKKRITASSITVGGNYIHGDADVVKDYLTIENTQKDGNTATFTGLNPKTQFNATYSIVVRYGNDNTYTYTSSKTTISTEALSLITQQPKVISAGNVIVAAKSNLDDAEENVGFEWRRTDWTDDFASNSGTAYLYEGTMEGYIRNLYTEKLWKYRPFYTSASGRTYYGEWVGIDPTNTSYFEPTVHTYATIEVQGNTAAVRGYAMRGTDNITRQGFMYWPQGASHVGRRDAPSVPSNALTIEATGTVMEAKLTGLSYNTTYSYVAFATTSEGETFYGDERQFTTDIDMSGIEEVEMSSDAATPETWYDLHGRRLSEPRHGINILRMSDGTSRKIFVP